jgi:hypothetical protein
MAELIILVPTRGRPQNVAPIIEAWRETGAFGDGGELIFIIDADDPACAEYQQEIRESPYRCISFLIESEWRPLVPKLNRVALSLAELGDTPLGFMGDDHLPRTEGWVGEYLRALETSPSIVSTPDGFRRDDLPTHWAMSAEIVRALGRMVPATVSHLYCDNSVRDLAIGAGIYSWLPDILIEHMHPLAGKAQVDPGYIHVNSAERYGQDMASYAIWKYRGEARDIEKVRALRGQ